MSARFCIVPAKVIGDRRLTRTDIEVLHAIGLFADKHGWCWPSHQELADRIAMDRSTVIRSMKKLKDYGYIAVAARADSAGRKISNKYRIIFDTEDAEPAETLDVAPLPHACGNTSMPHACGTNNATAIKNTPIEHPNNISLDSDFEEFYKACPRKEDKLAARKAYVAARKQATAAQLLAAMTAFAASTAGKEKQFIKLPATWLRAGSWLNEAGGVPPPKVSAAMTALNKRFSAASAAGDKLAMQRISGEIKELRAREARGL